MPLRLGESPDSEAEPARTPAQRRSDALADVCRFFLDHQHHRPAGRHRPRVNVVIEFEDLQAGRAGRVVDGPVLDGPAVQALACDSALRRLVLAGRSAVLDYGTATCTIPAMLWNALVVRDEHCRFPGCDRQATWCEGHHVIHIADDGPTCLENIVLGVQPPSPPPAPAGLARQAPTRRHLGGHRSRRAALVHRPAPGRANPGLSGASWRD